MSSLPLVSVGAINYNNSKYVLETLESILHQTYGNIELIIVDDCSTDNSLAIIEDWLKEYKKPFKLIKHRVNKGVCAACNSAVKNASGKYLSLIATDDVMMPEKIKVQVSPLENSSADVAAIYSDAYLIKEDSAPRYGWFINRIRDFEDLPSGNIYDELMEYNFLPAMSLLIRIDCLEQVGLFDEELQYEDYDMWLRLSRKYKIIFSNYISVKYRVRKNSLGGTIRNWNKDLVKIYQKHINDHPQAVKKLEKIAWDAYRENDHVALNRLMPVCDKSKLIRKVILFDKWKMPKPIAYRLLQKFMKD